MPARNSLKVYDENGYYHVYNRGVEKRNIFRDAQDYAVFISYLKFYLSPPNPLTKEFPSKKLKNYFGEIDLICYCLMANHFHLLIRQHSSTAMTGFMRSLMTRYSKYFNTKYHRDGFLFQGRYKAVQVLSEEQLVYLSRYIHRNPATSKTVFEVLEKYPYSSLAVYTGKIRQIWVQADAILNLFSKTIRDLNYVTFMVGEEIPESIDSLILDEDATATSKTVFEVG